MLELKFLTFTGLILLPGLSAGSEASAEGAWKEAGLGVVSSNWLPGGA